MRPPPWRNWPGCWLKAVGTRAAHPLQHRRRPPYPPRPRRPRVANLPIPICCSVSRPRRDWRSAKSSRSAAWRSPWSRRVPAWMPSAATSPPRLPRRRDSSPRCARSSTPKPIRPKPRSLPPTKSWSPIPIFSRLPSPPSPRARARRSHGRRRSRRTPTGSRGCATNCSRSARTTCAMWACACCRS